MAEEVRKSKECGPTAQGFSDYMTSEIRRRIRLHVMSVCLDIVSGVLIGFILAHFIAKYW